MSLSVFQVIHVFLLVLSVRKGPGQHRPVPDVGEERRFCVGGDPGNCHLQQQELSAAVCCLCQLCSQVLNSFRRVSEEYTSPRRSYSSVTMVCCPLLQWYPGRETDLVSGADRRCKACKKRAAGRRKSCSWEQPARPVSNSAGGGEERGR